MDKSYLVEPLEAKGPEAILLEIAKGLHGSLGTERRSQVDAWLESKRLALEASDATKRDAREEATLSIAKEANRIASSALAEARLANRSRWTDRIIMIITIIIATIAAREDIIWLVLWLINKITSS